MAEQSGGLKGSKARALTQEQARLNEPRTPGPVRYDGRYPIQVPHDRTDRHNLRYRRRRPLTPLLTGWAAWRTAEDRRHTLAIDQDRIRTGVRAVRVPPGIEERHDWFGRRRRRAKAETPLPRAHRHHDDHRCEA